jgi:hypothetical protein
MAGDGIDGFRRLNPSYSVLLFVIESNSHSVIACDKREAFAQGSACRSR